MNTSEDFLTVQEAADALKVSISAIRNAIAVNRLSHVVKYGRILVSRNELEAYRQRTQPDGIKRVGRPMGSRGKAPVAAPIKSNAREIAGAERTSPPPPSPVGRVEEAIVKAGPTSPQPSPQKKEDPQFVTGETLVVIRDTHTYGPGSHTANGLLLAGRQVRYLKTNANGTYDVEWSNGRKRADVRARDLARVRVG